VQNPIELFELSSEKSAAPVNFFEVESTTGYRSDSFMPIARKETHQIRTGKSDLSRGSSW